MSEAEISNSQSLSLAGSNNSIPPGSEMMPAATPATQSLSQQGIQGIDPTHNLISRNRHLLEQVGQLEQALRQYQEELQFQQARGQTQETLLLQHKELLKASEEQVNRLFKELESSHQVNQRQQILIETLSHQVENSQERLAQLERDCALTQQRYQEQFHQLQQAESTRADLEVRLERQQQQTLQFKAALEKSLEVSTSSYLPQETDATEEFALEEEIDSPLSGLSEDFELLTSDYQPNSDWEELADLPGSTPVAANLKVKQNLHTPSKTSSDAVSLPPLPKPLDPHLPADSIPNASVAKSWEAPEPDRLQDVLENLAEPLKSEIEEAIALGVDTPEAEKIETEEKEEGDLVSTTNWTSNLVNPLKPTKRLKSWAAIDLPRFPKFRRSSQ